MTTAFITHAAYADHDMPGHPEHAGRIKSVWKALEETGLRARMLEKQAEPISDDQILAVHRRQYLDLLNEVSGYDTPVRLDADTYVLPQSPQIARISAGGVVGAVDAVLSGEAHNALATVRPPGHHAIAHRGMGFCILGNVAIAARHAQNHYGVRRIMIVDYDVHHGNGTQDMFYDDDTILFVSIHQSPFYPGSGAAHETGRGNGRGFTLNIPLSVGIGDEGYLAVFRDVIWPAARRFQPEFIIVSAGFDAHWIDPLASMRLSLNGYARLDGELLRMAQEFCEGKIIFVMEGGYDLTALSYGIVNIAHALLGDALIEDPLGPISKTEPDIRPLIEQIRKIHDL